MTKLKKWQKDNTPIPKIIVELKNMVLDKYWDTYFLIGDNGEHQIYTSTLDYMYKTVHLSRCGYASTIYSEDLALQLIRDALSENIEHIARWIKSDESSMQMMIFGSSGIGSILYYKDRDRCLDENASYAVMCMRKNDIPCKNASGFFVEFLYPVDIGT